MEHPQPATGIEDKIPQAGRFLLYNAQHALVYRAPTAPRLDRFRHKEMENDRPTQRRS